MEGDRNEDKAEKMTTHESGEGGHGAEDWDLTEKRGYVENMDGMEEDWEEAGQRLLGSGAELRNPESQQPFAVHNVALKPPFNWKALWRIMAFYYCFKARELCQEHYYLQSRVCQWNSPSPI